MNELKVIFKYRNETKGTHRYEEVSEDEPIIIGSLYIKKYAIEGDVPNQLEVIVKELK